MNCLRMSPGTVRKPGAILRKCSAQALRSITLLAGTPRPAKKCDDGFGQTGYIACQYEVDLVIIGALWDRIHRHCRPAARTKHPTKLREAPCRLGEEHQPEIADHRVESFL